MKGNVRRMLVTAMAGVMAVSMSAQAFAAETGVNLKEDPLSAAGSMESLPENLSETPEKESEKKLGALGASENHYKQIKAPSTTDEGVSTWDCVWFGNYWQGDTNDDGHCFSRDMIFRAQADENVGTVWYDQDGHVYWHFTGEVGVTYRADDKERIKWRVLSIDQDGKALLLSDSLLEIEDYNCKYYGTETWEKCTLRSYLNSYDQYHNSVGNDYRSKGFLKNAFDSKEISAISNTYLLNNANVVYGTQGGNPTTDKVFCLSQQDMLNPDYGFVVMDFDQPEGENRKFYTKPDPTRVARGTQYLTDKDYYYACLGTTFTGAAHDYWTRSPGNSSTTASDVGSNGCVNAAGVSKDTYTSFSYNVTNIRSYARCVRPALVLDLKNYSSLWEYAGVVSSDGTVKEEISIPDERIMTKGSTSLFQPVYHPTGEKCLSGEWDTDDPTVAQVDENGVVLALNEGSACITYTCKEHPFDTLECDVTVVSQGELKDPVTTASGVSTWDCVWLGKYWQDQDTNGDRKYDRNDEKTAIKWRILDIDDDGNALLLSDRLLDSCLFNDNANNKYKVEPWASCTLRSYLNSYDGTVNAAGNDYSSSGFLTEAFSEEEIEVIEEGTVVNDTNWFDWTSSGPDTEDKIFCLSMDESVNPGYGFVESYVVLTSGNYYADTADDPTRVAYDTSYSYTRTGASTIGQNKRKGNWLLRTQIGDSYYVSGISTTGKMSAKHTYVYTPGRFIRPALRINLTDNEDFWCYAGTVCSDGTMNEEEPRVKVKDVSLPDSETVMEKMSITLTPTIYPENATYTGVTWSSSDKNVAVVKDGVVTGVGPGYADITVVTDDGGWDAVCRVTVEPFVVKPPETTGDEKTVWDGIWFGSYPQSKGKTNGTYEEEPIKWRVLEMDDDGTVLLLSDKLLDAAPYNTEAAEVTWETSSLRAFLNGTGDYLTKGFVDSAFSASERKGIISSLLENENNPIYDDTEGGEDTEDLIFCLSVSEAMDPEYGFEVNDFISSKAYTEPDVTRKAFASQYAENALGLAAGSAGAWWLRSPGRYTSQAARVDNEGSIRAQGSAANDQATGIRPAIRLTLSDSSLWSFAGKIYSDGTKDEVQPEKKDEKDIAVRSIVLPGSEKVEEDGSITLRPVIYPFDAWDQTVEWSSSNDKVAVVDENGVVTGVGEGYADITAKTNDGGFEATCRVTVEKKPTVSVNGIKFTLSENNIFVGDTRELVPVITPADATDKSVSWRSTDESVAEVNEKGVVTGKTEGYAFIIARTNDGGLEAKCRVNVSERPAEVKHVNGVAVRAELTVVEGGTWTLTPVITPSDADDKTVTWSSSAEGIATVDDHGVVTGVKEGSANITVKTNDGGFEATCRVTVKKKPVEPVPVKGVKLPEEQTVKKGEKIKLYPEISPENATDKSVSWSSVDPGIASVDEDGIVTGISAGNTYVSVITVDGGFSASCNVLVKDDQNSDDPDKPDVPDDPEEVLNTSLTMIPGEVRSLNVGDRDQYVFGASFTLSDENPKGCVSVKSGVVTAKKPGKAVVTAAYGSSKIIFDIKVSGEAPETKVLLEGNKTIKLSAPKSLNLVVGKADKKVNISIPAGLRDASWVIKGVSDEEGVCGVTGPDFNNPDRTKATKASFMVKAVDAGATYIVWNMRDPEGKTVQASTKVIVKKPVTDIAISQGNLMTLTVGTGERLKVTGTGGNTDAKKLSFSVKGRGIKVSKSGYVFAATPEGYGAVTVKCGKAKAEIRVNATGGTATKTLALNKMTMNMKIPKPNAKKPSTSALKISVPKKKNDKPELSWSMVGSPKGIEVDRNGVVKVTTDALPGCYEVRATAPDGSGFNDVYCEVIVQ